MKIRQIQTNFTSGEVSERLHGRVESVRFANGAKRLKNMIVGVQGGAYRRPGSVVLEAFDTPSGKYAIRRFVFSRDDAFLLIFYEKGLHFIKDKQYILTGGYPYEVVTPYSEDDVADLKLTQSADVMYITHKDYPPMQLSRVADDDWDLEEVEFFDGPYGAVEPEAVARVKVLQDTALATASTAIFTADTLKNIVKIYAYQLQPYIYCTAVEVTAHGWSTNDFITLSGTGSSKVNGRWVISKLDDNNFYLLNSPWHDETSGIGKAMKSVSGAYVEIRTDNRYQVARIWQQVSTTVAQVDLVDYSMDYDPGIKVTFSGSTLTSSSALFANDDIGKIIRASSGLWYDITAFTDSTHVTGVAVATVAWSSPTVITISERLITATFVSDVDVLASTDVGRKVRFNFDGQWVPGKIVEYVDAKNAALELDETVPVDPRGPRPAGFTWDTPFKFSCDGQATSWKFGAFSETTGYPAVCCFHQQRLCFGSTTSEPVTLWLSETGDYTSFAPTELDSTVLDTNSITAVLVSPEVNNIVWMSSGPVLLIGTTGAEWQVKPAAITQGLTPTNIIATVQTTYGSELISNVVRAGSASLFVQRGGTRVREMTYDYSLDAFVSKDLTVISEHLSREYGEFTETALQVTPNMILWVLTSDKKLLGMTYDREQEVVAWHEHEIAGDVADEILSIAVLPSSDGDVDELYLFIKRCAVHTIECLTDSNTNFLDGSYSYDRGGIGDLGAITIPALYLGLTLHVMIDGVYIGTRTVTYSAPNYIITLGYIGRRVTVGFKGSAIVGLLPADTTAPMGTTSGGKSRLVSGVMRIIDSVFPKIGSAVQTTDAREMLARSVEVSSSDWTRLIPVVSLATDNYPTTYVYPTSDTSPVAVVSGDLSFLSDDSFDAGAEMQIAQDEPYPLNIVSVVREVSHD